MTREQAINYLISSGFSEEQVSEVVRALTYEPTTKNDLGVDAISRAEAQTEIEMNASRYTIARERGGMGQVEWSDQLIKVSDTVDIIRNLPSVTPQEPRKGHWIEYSWNDNGFARWGLKCDKCYKKYKYGGEMWNNPSFCPNCGADMREVEE